MKIRIKILTVLLAVYCLPTVLHGQSGNVLLDTITWTAYKDKNLLTGDDNTRTTTFVSYGNNQVQITHGTRVSVFSVTSVDSTWTDVTQVGQVVFHVSYYGASGTITLARDEIGAWIILDMSADSMGVKNKYFIKPSGTP